MAKKKTTIKKERSKRGSNKTKATIKAKRSKHGKGK